MKRIGIAAVVFVFASAANAQSVSGRVTGAVGEVGSVAGQTGVGPALSGPQAPGSSNLPNSSFLGGELPGGVNKMKLGDKVIDLRGNVGVGDNGGNFTAGVGLPFLKAAHSRVLQRKACEAGKIDANLNETAQSSA